MKTLSLLGLFITPVLVLYLYERVQLLIVLVNNAPHKLQHFDAALGDYQVKFADEIRNCEDVILVEHLEAAILSCDPGREKWNTVMNLNHPGPMGAGGLWVYDYSPSGQQAPPVKVEFVGYEEDEFHPLGVSFHKESSTLYAVNHLRDGLRIDIFGFDFTRETKSAPRAVHKRFIKHPLLHSPNSIALINEHELYVTNDHYFLYPKYLVMRHTEDYLPIPGGSVAHVDLRSDTVRTLAHQPFANGIEVFNETTLAVASTTGGGVYLYAIDPASRDLTYRTKIKLPFMADNISQDENGALLVAGHPHPFSLYKWAKTRHICNSDVPDEELCAATKVGSWVAEWTEERGLRTLYRSTEFPTACTAARDVRVGVGIMTGLYAHGILVWKGE